jgi:2-hydroxychromene-2-carboxylate isomerase
MSDKLGFYFSSRSPYSWLALYRLILVMDELPVEIQMIPVFPAVYVNINLWLVK